LLRLGLPAARLACRRTLAALCASGVAAGALGCGGRAERDGSDRSRDCAGESCSGEASVTLERFGWTSREAPLPMGSVEGRACFLLRVGGQFDSAEDSVQIVAEDGQWLLTGSAASGGFVEAAAACVSASGITEEARWEQGQEPIELHDATTHACFLTGVAGRFEGGGEVLSLIRSGHWYLSGASLQPELAGSARCMLMEAMSEPFGMEFDTPSPVLSLARQDGACYLTVLCGNLGAEGDALETAWNGSGWELRRQVGAGRSLRASAACFGRAAAAGAPASAGE
jgi:hypothetical protein